MNASTDATPPSPPSRLPGGDIPFGRFLDCVHCGLCTSACPTYLETGNENESPRGRIYLMRGVVEGRIPLTPEVGKHLDLCLDCRSCESACPSGVQYGRLIEPFRVDMRKQHISGGKSPGKLLSWILLHLFPYPQRLKWTLWPARLAQRLKLDSLATSLGLLNLLPVGLRRMHRLLPPLGSRQPELPEFLPAIGPRRATVALFRGCVADAMFDQVNWATARVLQQNGCDVLVPAHQACCGAIDYHSGQEAPALEKIGQNLRAFPLDRIDAVIINVAGCGSMLKDYGHVGEEAKEADPAFREQLARFAGKVQDIHEFLVKLGPVPPQGELNCRVAYHDACHLCHAQQIRKPPRTLLEMIPGLTLVPVPEPEVCCGAAGSYNLVETEMSDRLARRKVNNLLGSGGEIVASANAGCTLQIQAELRDRKRIDIPVRHPVELLDFSYRHLPLS